MEVIDKFHSHDGEQLIVKHYSSSNKCEMKFSLFLPPASRSGKFQSYGIIRFNLLSCERN